MTCVSLDSVDRLRAHATDVTSVRLAAWYHDAVYNGRPDYEATSAARAETELAIPTKVPNRSQCISGMKTAPGESSEGHFAW